MQYITNDGRNRHECCRQGRDGDQGCLLVGVLGRDAGRLARDGVGTAYSGVADFCDPATYDNANPQTTGLFTDLRRGGGIKLDDANCVLNITGSTGSAGDMWITLLDSPGNPTPPPTFSCVFMEAPIFIHRFDNRKAIGFVSNVQPGVDPGTGTGLFWGVYDNGNTDALTLSTFQDGKLTSTVTTLPLGSMIKEDILYLLVGAGLQRWDQFVETAAAVTDEAASYGELKIPDGTLLPSGISASGRSALPGRPRAPSSTPA